MARVSSAIDWVYNNEIIIIFKSWLKFYKIKEIYFRLRRWCQDNKFAREVIETR